MQVPACIKAGCADKSWHHTLAEHNIFFEVSYLTAVCFLLSMLMLDYSNKSDVTLDIRSATALQEISQFPYAGACVYACASSLPSYVSVQQMYLLTPCPL